MPSIEPTKPTKLMKRILTPPERLIVAADFKPTTKKEERDVELLGICSWTRQQVLALADKLEGTGVYLKVNSALRACGYNLIHDIQSRNLRVFADLKLFDIGATLEIDGIILKETEPELLTVAAPTGIAAMTALKSQLPNTEVLAATILTSITEEEANKTYRHAVLLDNVCMFARNATSSGVDGIICSAAEAPSVRRNINPNMTINTPAIRPAWAIVPGDDQNPDRIMTPAKAILVGVDRIVIGRPITQAENPYDAVMRTLEEIASVAG